MYCARLVCLIGERINILEREGVVDDIDADAVELGEGETHIVELLFSQLGDIPVKSLDGFIPT